MRRQETGVRRQELFVGGDIGIKVLAQVEGDTVVIAVIGLLVERLQGLVAECHRIVQTCFGLCHLIAGDVVVALDVGADSKIECRLVGTHDTDLTIAAGGLSANGLHGHPSLKAHLTLQTLMFRRHAMQVCGSKFFTLHS